MKLFRCPFGTIEIHFPYRRYGKYHNFFIFSFFHSFIFISSFPGDCYFVLFFASGHAIMTGKLQETDIDIYFNDKEILN